jgi:hypothetical protein
MRLGKTEISLKLFWKCWCPDHGKEHVTGLRFPFLICSYPNGGRVVRFLWIEVRTWGQPYATKRTDATPLPTFTCIDGALPIPKRRVDQ